MASEILELVLAAEKLCDEAVEKAGLSAEETRREAAERCAGILKAAEEKAENLKAGMKAAAEENAKRKKAEIYGQTKKQMDALTQSAEKRKADAVKAVAAYLIKIS